jgi:hypothetical protein
MKLMSRRSDPRLTRRVRGSTRTAGAHDRPFTVLSQHGPGEAGLDRFILRRVGRESAGFPMDRQGASTLTERRVIDADRSPFAEVTPQHRELVFRLRRFLKPWRPVTISIDGRASVGKSSLARFLSWQLGVPCVETDLLLQEGDERVSHDLAVILQLLIAHYAHKRPVIVEGILVERTLADIGVCPDFAIYVEADGRETSHALRAEFRRYEAAFEPLQRANFRFQSRAVLSA